MNDQKLIELSRKWRKLIASNPNSKRGLVLGGFITNVLKGRSIAIQRQIMKEIKYRKSFHERA